MSVCAGMSGCDHGLKWTVYSVLTRVVTDLSPFITFPAAPHVSLECVPCFVSVCERGVQWW